MDLPILFGTQGMMMGYDPLLMEKKKYIYIYTHIPYTIPLIVGYIWLIIYIYTPLYYIDRYPIYIYI